ncbi:hypothetical protein BDD43_3697 [Mucilaginibacter gracilis]|uniref:N-acetyltransferase domain-containing protein n=1 Tax=Mucilaginibacter gracilis TaxID=423350 RepID=A0A495J509_9SPHI|nr:GNAT family N-acetyltransferase [Mucilaginibacter gracilis]RKR83488.1 hypothetical protein BDD43_3697 [Mucilaginibacter gracilis]
MNNRIVIRKVNATEADALLQLSKKTFFDAFAAINNANDMEAYAAVSFTHQKIEMELNTPGSAFYFAVYNNEVVGYVKLNTGDAQTEFQDSYGFEIERIYILAKHQGKGFGEQLINYAIATAKREAYKYIWLGVFEKNVNAIRFYERHGFSRFSDHYFMLGTDKQKDVLMKKEL